MNPLKPVPAILSALIVSFVIGVFIAMVGMKQYDEIDKMENLFLTDYHFVIERSTSQIIQDVATIRLLWPVESIATKAEKQSQWINFRAESARLNQSITNTIKLIIDRHSLYKVGVFDQTINRLNIRWDGYFTTLEDISMTVVEKKKIANGKLSATSIAAKQLLRLHSALFEGLRAERLKAEALSGNIILSLLAIVLLVIFIFMYWLVRIVKKSILHQKSLTKELILEKDRAQRASESKSKFLASMSHEFRTPLNAILGFSEVISMQMMGPIGKQKYREYAEDIHTSATHLHSLINDLLDLSAISAGKTKLQKEETSVNDISRECFKIVSSQAETAGVITQLNQAKKIPNINADKKAIKQIIINLLNNAIKFTPKEGSVILSTKVNQNKIEICVKDTGRGISKEMLSKLTKPYIKENSDPHLSAKGWGLGLAITQSLVEMHKGRLTFESEVGKGTIAKVILPINA
jgi:signal transduction histidine kinase